MSFELANKKCPNCGQELPALCLIWSGKAKAKVCRPCWAKAEGTDLDHTPSIFGGLPADTKICSVCGRDLDEDGICEGCDLLEDVCECERLTNSIRKGE